MYSTSIQKCLECPERPEVWMHVKHLKDDYFPNKSIRFQVDECAFPTSFDYDIKIYLQGQRLVCYR